MFEIINKIKIGNKVNIYKKIFINEEMFPKISTRFFCSCCNSENKIEIIPYKDGFPFYDLYEIDIIKGTDIISKRMAEKTSSDKEYLGSFLVNDLPTFYFSKKCMFCNINFLVVYGLGEQQSGKEICEISGVWAYTTIND